MSSVKRASICALCIALCYVLPLAFHALGLGSAFSPMHIPVMLCGLVCGWFYGGLCGIIGPILSSMSSSMPPAAMLIYMVPELFAYGVVCGLLMRFLRTRNAYADLYISLGCAMVAGRILAGAVRGLVYMGSEEPFTLALWATAYFVEGIPAIASQFILLPALYFTLTKARLIPPRYPNQKAGAKTQE